MELIIYADESTKKGKFYSNFYAGLLVRSPDEPAVVDHLEHVKGEQNIFGEVKWEKVTSQYLEKYSALMDAFFDLVAADKVKVRVMFTQNRQVAVGLEKHHVLHRYELLYYQLLKHAFGLQHSRAELDRATTQLRLRLDRLPLNNERKAAFRSHLSNLTNNPQFRRAGIRLEPGNVAEIDSSQHVLAQCLDVVLGAMQFRLNDKHLVRPNGAKRRGKKTIAKEKLFKQISRRIRSIYTNFNIGISTGTSDLRDRWLHPYRHWLFIPKDSSIDTDPSLRKKGGN